MLYKALLNGNKSQFDKTYEVGVWYDVKDDKSDKNFTEIIPYNWGYHSCQKPQDCNIYYPHSPSTKYFEVELSGDIKYESDIVVSSKIRLIKEITTNEWEILVNGKKNYAGMIIWYSNGYLNDPDPDTPAIKWNGGSYQHYKMGKLHRLKGLPATKTVNFDPYSIHTTYCLDGRCLADVTSDNRQICIPILHDYWDELSKLQQKN